MGVRVLSVSHLLLVAQMQMAVAFDLDDRGSLHDLLVFGLSRSRLWSKSLLLSGGLLLGDRLLLALEEVFLHEVPELFGALVGRHVEHLVWKVGPVRVLEAEIVDVVPEQLLVHLEGYRVGVLLPLPPGREVPLDCLELSSGELS